MWESGFAKKCWMCCINIIGAYALHKGLQKVINLCTMPCINDQILLLEMILKQPLQKDYFTSLLQNYWKPWNACFTARCTRYWHHYNKKQQIDISLDKCHRVTTERSHCLGPALEIETSHRRLVRQRKLPSVLKVGHLESHLYEGIGTDLEKWLTGHNVITSNN